MVYGIDRSPVHAERLAEKGIVRIAKTIWPLNAAAARADVVYGCYGRHPGGDDPERDAQAGSFVCYGLLSGRLPGAVAVAARGVVSAS
ncbi:hypothetical protein ACVXG7_29450 [Enterobacter hormaechei]